MKILRGALKIFSYLRGAPKKILELGGGGVQKFFILQNLQDGGAPKKLKQYRGGGCLQKRQASSFNISFPLVILNELSLNPCQSSPYLTIFSPCGLLLSL